ncbi:MAG: molybdopterin-dependent oxidoreductase [Nitrospirae bacterium]|nr:molybdopterin-dependent oxidoreductase [Nitrospirota bacterium]
MLPGGRPIGIDSFRKRYEEFFNVEIPSDQGLSLMEIIEGAHSRKIKALYVMGENVAFNIPDNKFVTEALSGLELMVVQDVFLTETAGYAHVVLPALSWAEKEGSYTNLEGRMQHLKKVIEGQGLEDWRILGEISRMLGVDMKYSDPKDILSEIAKVSPLHKGIDYEDMAGGQCMWPYKGEPLRHDINIEGIDLPDIRSLLKKPEYDKIYIGIDKPLFHSASLSRNSSALNSISSGPYAKIGRGLADKLSISDWDYISVSTASGSVELPVFVDADVPVNIVLVPNNFEGRGAFKVLSWKKNSIIKSPALDGNEVTLKKIERAAEVSA